MKISKQKLSGSALLHVLFILLAVLSIIAAALLTIKLYSIPAKQAGKEVFNRRSISEFAQYYAHFKVDNKNRIDLIHASPWNGSIALVEEHQWGTKNIVSVQLVNEQDTIAKAFITGAALVPKKALHILKRSTNLLHAGQAQLYGNLFSSARVKSSYIENQSPKTPFINNGVQSQQKNDQVPKELKETIEFALPSSIVEPLVPIGSQVRTYRNSFLATSQLIEAEQIALNSLDSIIGNFILTSNDTLTIPSSLYLEHVLCYAPTIIVSKNCRLKGVELISTKETIVQEQAQLLFPSGIATSGTKSNIHIEKSVTIEGDIITKSRTASDQQKNWPHVFIEDNAIVSGVVYADGTLDLRGKVIGSVYCKLPIVFTKSGVYGNTILNGIIDRNSLPPFWASSLLKPTEKIEIVAWLD